MTSTGSVAAAIAERARETGALAIDTEFVGEGRYRPLLCLVQVAVAGDDGEQWVEVFDPLDEKLDPAPLVAVLADPAVEVVFHAGRQDVAILRRAWGADAQKRVRHADRRGLRRPARAARLRGAARRAARRAAAQERELHALGHAAAERQSSSTTRARTSCTCSTPRAPSRSACSARSACSGRTRSAAALEDVNDDRPADAVFARLPRINSLDPSLRAVAYALTQWREDSAMQEDKPVQTILSDAALVEIAKRRPEGPRSTAPDPRAARGDGAPPRQGDPRRGRRAGASCRRSPSRASARRPTTPATRR